MKKLPLIIIFLLTFQNISLADTISEYEEAGLKLGKSILEIMTMDKIIENIVQKEGEKYVGPIGWQQWKPCWWCGHVNI